MNRILAILIIGLGLLTAVAAVADLTIDVTVVVGNAGGSTPFTPLHTYFMSPTGSDSNNGLTTSTAWASPNHAVVCGDVIIAQAGNYSPQTTWGTVSNCPSTTGGIDGAGGVYFATLLCAGNVGTCSVVFTSPPGVNSGIEFDKDNWAIEGWAVSGGYTTSTSGFGFMINTGNNTGVRHYFAIVNNISYFNASGFSTNNYGTNGGSGYGADYWAIVGNIAQDSAGRNDGFWDGAIDVIGIADYNATAGTHIFVSGNYSYNNQQTTGGNSDGECYLFDTLDLPTPGYSQQIVMKNNIGAVCERFGLQFFYQGYTSTTPLIKVYNNTHYASNQGNYTNGTGTAWGDINIQGDSEPALPWLIRVYNNIAQENKEFPAGGGDIYALMDGGNYTGPKIGNVSPNPANSENIFKGLQTSCDSTCDPGNNVITFGGSFGINTYVSPAFNNTTDLLANRIGTPSCGSFTNTTACMGWNYATQTATNPSLIYDLTPTAAQAAGKGFQPPTNCTADADYPTWLKGIVYLQASGFANGATVTENSGLVTKPCGM